MAVLVSAQRQFQNCERTQLSTTKCRPNRGRMPLGANSGGGHAEVLKCSKLLLSSNGEISTWNAVKHRQLYFIVGKCTGTAVSRRRAQRKLAWRLSCKCRQQTAFIDVLWWRYYASMRFLKFRVNTGDGLATIVCASARSVTPHGGLHASTHLCDVLLHSLPLFGNHRRWVAFNGTQWQSESDYIYKINEIWHVGNGIQANYV